MIKGLLESVNIRFFVNNQEVNLLGGAYEASIVGGPIAATVMVEASKIREAKELLEDQMGYKF